MRTWRSVFSLILGLVAVWALTTPAQAAIKIDPCETADPTMLLQQCRGGAAPTAAPGPPLPRPTSAPSSRGGVVPVQPSPSPASPTPSPSASPGIATASPSTPAEQLATDTGKSVSGLAPQLKDAYRRPLGPAWSSRTITAYSFTFALGLVIFAIALLVTFARVSKNTPQRRAEFMAQTQKLFLYYPIMMFMPALVKWGLDIAAGFSEGLVRQSGSSFTTLLDSITTKMGADPFSFVTGGLGGVVVALILLGAVLLTMLLWLVMDITAQFGVQLLLLLIPITGALSIFPNAARRWSSRAIGFTLGCLLTPVVSRFAFWVMWLIGADMVAGSANVLHSLLMVVVILGIGTAAPMVLGYIMPMILPQAGGIYGGGGGSTNRPVQELVQRGWNAVESLGGRLSPSQAGGMAESAAAEKAGSSAVAQASSSGARSAAASTGGSRAGAAVGGASAAGGAAAAVGGAAAGVLWAAAKGIEAVQTAGKTSAALQLQAGGGATSAAEPPLQMPRGSARTSVGYAGRGPAAAATESSGAEGQIQANADHEDGDVTPRASETDYSTTEYLSANSNDAGESAMQQARESSDFALEPVAGDRYVEAPDAPRRDDAPTRARTSRTPKRVVPGPPPVYDAAALKEPRHGAPSSTLPASSNTPPPKD